MEFQAVLESNNNDNKLCGRKFEQYEEMKKILYNVGLDCIKQTTNKTD